MNRDDDTAQLAASDDGNDAPAPGDPVGRVNLPEEQEPEPTYDYGEESQAGPGVNQPAPQDQLREKVLFGALTIALMIAAMFVILQGVFEQKMPV